MDYTQQLTSFIGNYLEGTEFSGFGEFYRGKVRDNYVQKEQKRRILVTTDRQSAFDRNLGFIPCKGQALNQLAVWWFEQTKDIVNNHIIDVPDPNVMVCKNVETFPIEMVIRGYMTGSTSTSVWTVYKNGDREYCGNVLPEGMKKNEPFETPIITPTTKSDEHDEKISPDEIVKQGLATQEEWDKLVEITQSLFARGKEIAQKGGLILVDTKYEFGKDEEGNIVLIDEIHTPDSSRFWIADTYGEKFAAGEEPESFSKEFLRLWFNDRCDPYKDEVLPDMPDELRIQVAQRYIDVYEKLTGLTFEFPPEGENIVERIGKNLEGYKL
jgi:phosphoribosylaminoimidazole-succinocarboxamide synthase